ncbi:MAG TPA: NapC/NirT family cytochrome c [Verrucomicrobiae bacterium]|nr:NapC/NirT family cytochrome c [Verrucomicrobiae bacterium]
MTDANPSPVPRFHFLRNWLSMSGLVVALGSLFAFLLLFLLDLFAHFANPYIGVLTYLVAPGFLMLGVVLTVVGALLQNRHRLRAGGTVLTVQFDLARARDRRFLGLFIAGSIGFLFITAVGSYYSYHYTESVQFCGQACHTVMQPEMVTYQHSPHARVACVACHIGPGATWFVKSKLSGTYQVYATLTHKYPRPIPTPVKNLRPAQDTCEHCHWPREFIGNLDRTFVSYLSDKTNPVFTVRLLLKVGGADPTRGPVGGIHWHMSVANKVQYIATDEGRQKIPWVRLTDSQGVVTEYRIPSFTNDISQYEIRTMDCMDCHNRPSHQYATPNDAVDLALRLGHIDAGLPWIKTNAVWVLTRPYTNQTQAFDNIATTLANEYPDEAPVRQAIASVQQIYQDNFFPEMKASWRDYPNNIGHKDWPGCTRCHDDNHFAADHKRKITFSNCQQCHIILAQSSGEQSQTLKTEGVPFNHPAGDYSGMACNDCHNGG